MNWRFSLWRVRLGVSSDAYARSRFRVDASDAREDMFRRKNVTSQVSLAPEKRN